MFRLSAVTWDDPPHATDRTRYPTTGQWVVDLPDPGRDLALAEQAVAYLRGHGLDDGAVIQCLRDEFEIDLATAERMAAGRGMGQRETASG